MEMEMQETAGQERKNRYILIRSALVVGGLVLLMLSGCATPLPALTDNLLQIGRTTKSDVKEKLGAPNMVFNTIIDGQKIEGWKYYKIHPGGMTYKMSAVAEETRMFSFLGERLVGYRIISTLSKSETDFDTEKALSIKEGMTLQEVISLLGAPHQKEIQPLIADGAKKMVGYNDIWRGSLTGTRRLSIFLSDDDTVLHAVYFSDVDE